jgi:hypothetical protein
VAADFSGRVQLTPRHAALGLHSILGFRAGTLLWDYRNPILLEEDGVTRSVGDDWINYYAPYAGLGVSLVRTERLEVGVQGVAGVRFYDRHTHEGLYNDRFGSAEFGQVTVETSVRF